MPDYSNGKIYTIRSHQTDDIYIGSTTQPLSERFRDHKKKFKYWKDGRGDNVSSYQIIKYDDAYIELLEDYDCERREQLHKREGEYIRKMNCVNKVVPGRTDKEYRNDNKEKIADQKKKYHQDNREQIAEQKRLYYQNNRERMLYNFSLYREKNKEQIAERDKLYREKNKERIKAHKSRVCVCDCGTEYTHSHKSRHLRSKKHQAYIASLNKT